MSKVLFAVYGALPNANQANAQGLQMRAQVAARAIGVLVGLQATVNPLRGCPSFKALGTLSLSALVSRLGEADTRAAIISEYTQHCLPIVGDASHIFVLGADPNYEPDAQATVSAFAARAGCSSTEMLYDLLLAGVEGGIQ